MAVFKIYCGNPKPLTAIGKNQCRMLQFAEKHQQWHSYGEDRATLRALEGLEKRGSIYVDREAGQFAIAYSQLKR